MNGECDMYDLEMSIDVRIKYFYDRQEDYIELTSVKWYGSEIVEHIFDKTYDKIVEHIRDEDLWRRQEAC